MVYQYLQNNLDLQIKKNWQVFPTVLRGVDFVGYRHFQGFKLLRMSTCRRYKKQMIKFKNKIVIGEELSYNDRCSINSYSGWIGWCDGYRLSQKYCNPIKEYLSEYYVKNKERKVS